MEAPKKVYRTTTYLDSDRGKTVWKNNPVPGAENVEYTRTDAFIEKALAYLNEKFYFNNLHYAVENNTFNCMEEMFEDFKNYMKGE